MVELRLTRKLSRGESFDSVSVASQDTEVDVEDPLIKPILRNAPRKPPRRGESDPVKAHRARTPRKQQSEPIVEKPKQRTGRRIKFSDDVVIHPPPNGGPLTDEEWAAGFYNRQDIERFKEERSIIAQVYQRKLQSGCAWDDSKDSVRGVKDTVIGEGKTNIRTRHRNTVMAAQSKLKEGSVPDAEIVLAEIAEKNSKEARERALQMGRYDSYAGYRKPTPLMKKVRVKLSSFRF